MTHYHDDQDIPYEEARPPGDLAGSRETGVFVLSALEHFGCDLR